MGFFDIFKQADINQGVKDFNSCPGACLLYTSDAADD